MGSLSVRMATTLGVAWMCASPAAAQRVVDRVIDAPVGYLNPMLPCTLPHVVELIARTMHISAGVEHLAEPECMRTPPPPDKSVVRDRIELAGLTIGAALDQLTEHDPRYGWDEVDGVIGVRPMVAAAMPGHYLHRAIAPFRLDDERLNAAIFAWRAAVFGPERPFDLSARHMQTSEGERRFSVPARAATAIDALDAIVRAHGAMYWSVRYCQPSAMPQYATVWLYTSERGPSGVGIPLPPRFATVHGKTVDACSRR